ncbi:hypothetical protein BDW72DRAFT_44399 [Aspergillus terricola var. indicus]
MSFHISWSVQLRGSLSAADDSNNAVAVAVAEQLLCLTCSVINLVLLPTVGLRILASLRRGSSTAR